MDHADHGAGVSEGVIDGYYRMVAAYRVTGYPLVASATKTTAAILAHWERTAKYVAGAAAFVIAIIAAFAFLFLRLFRNYQALEQARSERKRAEQLREQSLRFDVALNNMSQGLVMFDASSKLVVCNSRFLEIYGLSPDVVKPGLTLLDLLKHRKERGSFGGDPDEYYAKLLNQIAKRTLSKQHVADPGGAHHPDRQPADAGRRLGRNPRGHYREDRRRKTKSRVRRSNSMRRSTIFRRAFACSMHPSA